MKTLKSFFTAFALMLPILAFSQGDLVGNWKTVGKMEDGSPFDILLSISDDGSFTVDFGADGQVDVKGYFETKDDQVTIVEKEGLNVECKDVKGVYKYTADAASLVMVRVEDACPGRSGPSGRMEFTRQ
jgi:hypothetical protein